MKDSEESKEERDYEVPCLTELEMVDFKYSF